MWLRYEVGAQIPRLILEVGVGCYAPRTSTSDYNQVYTTNMQVCGSKKEQKFAL